MDPWWAEALLGALAAVVAIGVGFVAGWAFGRKAAMKEHRRQLDYGKEYMDALEKAQRGLLYGQRLEVTLQARLAGVPERVGRAELRVIDGGEPDRVELANRVASAADPQRPMFPSVIDRDREI